MISDSFQHSHGYAPGISIHSKEQMLARDFVSRCHMVFEDSTRSARGGKAYGPDHIRCPLQVATGPFRVYSVHCFVTLNRAIELNERLSAPPIGIFILFVHLRWDPVVS